MTVIVLFLCTIYIYLLVFQLLIGSAMLLKRSIYNYPTKRVLSSDTVSVLIPTCNERRSVLEKTLLGCLGLSQCKEILLLENSSKKDNKEEAKNLCTQLGIQYFDIPFLGNKAKAINHFLKYHIIDSKYIAFLDADQIPKKHFISSLVPYLKESNSIAMVQARQDFRNKNCNSASFLYAAMQSIFYNAICRIKYAIHFSTCFGTNFIVKMDILKSVGYFDENCVTEDTATALKLILSGYKIVYVNQCVAEGLAPSTLKSILIQLKRYTIGNIQICIRLISTIISGRVNRHSVFPVLLLLHHSSSMFHSGVLVSLLTYCWCAGEVHCISLWLTYGTILLFLVLTFCIGIRTVIFGAFFYFLLSPLFLVFSFSYRVNYVDFSITPKQE